LLGRYGGSLGAGTVWYAVSCVAAAAVLVVSGIANHVVGQVASIGSGIMISGGGGSSSGAMNILVMGLESRTDFHGNQIDHHLQVMLHSGSQGGQATNTLILLHIFAGAQRAVGFSIPRDDWVTYPHTYDGQTQGKIDQAYGFAYAQSLSETVGSAESSDQRYLDANRAGQGATLDTVEAVTGQRIDHFAEVNLMGYYNLAQAFGGVTVCVKPWTAGNDQNLADANSGWDAVTDGYDKAKGGPQYLHLSPAQSLAYVRDRDSLPSGDLDRTHRQQAVLDYVIWKTEKDGLLSDVGQLEALLGSADHYLMTDPHWNLLDFSTSMKALSGKNLQFYTAPIAGYATIQDQSANVIRIPTIQTDISQKFTAREPGAHPAGTRPAGTDKAAVKTTPPSPVSTATVHVDKSLVTSAPAQTKTATPGSASPTTAGDNGAVGGAVTVGAKARYGVPCIY
jgi:anionic cell wall polymer biosynthesis LytR-Cps2A-Psr (LCP) family protein